MVGELITLPLRVGVRATRLWLRVAEESVAVAANAAGQLIDTVVSREPSGSSESREAPERQEPRPRETPPEERTSEARRVPTEARHAPPPAPPPPIPSAPSRAAVEPLPELSEPRHVSEEPELVGELAEAGAEDGAGAEVRVDEPWPAYDEMNAKQVISRLSDATPAELAAVQLYERGRRGRQTILAAAEREMHGANGGGSRS